MTTEKIRIVFVSNKLRDDPRLKTGFVEGAEKSLSVEVTADQKQHLLDEIVESLQQHCVRKNNRHTACLDIHDFGTVAIVLYERHCLPTTDHFDNFMHDVRALGWNIQSLST